MDAEAMALGLAILIAGGVALVWLIAFGSEHARKGRASSRDSRR